MTVDKSTVLGRMNRRRFLTLALAAPFVVRAGILMPVRAYDPYGGDLGLKQIAELLMIEDDNLLRHLSHPVILHPAQAFLAPHFHSAIISQPIPLDD